MIAYKVLGTDGTPCHGGTGRWHLPMADGPGEWMPAIPDPVPCRRGYHLCRDAADLLRWLGPTIWVAEVDGEVVADRDKVVAERARLVRRLPWDERTAAEFAADCAARALPVYEAAYPGDDRPRRAVEVARAYARGEATRDQLAAVGMAAAAADARAAADSTETASWAVEAAVGMAAAASAARAADAAADAAFFAVEAAGGAAEAAARAAAAAADAAFFAVEAAGGAAEAAGDTGDAGWAGWDAEDAERRWQAARLAELLGIPCEEQRIGGAS